jgi:flagellar hook-length control protein FliK
VAFDVRPPSASSSSAGTKSSSSKSPSTDLFAQNLAAAKQSSTSKPNSKSDSGDSNGKSSSATAADKSSASGKSSAAGSTQGSAANAAAAHSAQGGSTTGDAAAANSANGNSATNSVSKGRAPTRATTKTSAAQIAAAKGPGDAIDDPSADTSNQSGLSLLQLLAQSLQGDNSAAPATVSAATDSAATAATDKPADGSGATGNDPNAAALAAFTQALAAALGASTATQQGIVSNTAAGAAGGGTASVTGATQSSSGAAMQDLAALLAQTVAADAKGKSDANAPQLNVDPTKGTASDTSTANTAAAGPNSLAHLGVASHFSLQHTRADTSVSELESPVGSAAWNDELGSHLTWMTQNGLETGSLRVSPEHLGPVEVKISVQNGDASVWFGATHPDTRAALEQALPQLRAMFASQGMTLTDSGVSRESPRNQTKSQAPQSVSAVSAVGSADVSTSAAVRMSLGLVDTYA